jgi:hypothetical protein
MTSRWVRWLARCALIGTLAGCEAGPGDTVIGSYHLARVNDSRGIDCWLNVSRYDLRADSSWTLVQSSSGPGCAFRYFVTWGRFGGDADGLRFHADSAAGDGAPQVAKWSARALVRMDTLIFAPQSEVPGDTLPTFYVRSVGK